MAGWRNGARRVDRALVALVAAAALTAFLVVLPFSFD
jgi:hypothetical protein